MWRFHFEQKNYYNCRSVPPIEVKAYKARKGYEEDDAGPNNLGVLLLRQPLKYDSNVQRIPIAGKSPKVRDKAFASGWNSLYFSSIEPRHLHGLEVEISNVSHQFIYTDPFNGDFGGPLVVKGKLVGVLGGPKNERDVHCNLTNLHNWVRSTVVKNIRMKNAK